MKMQIYRNTEIKIPQLGPTANGQVPDEEGHRDQDLIEQGGDQHPVQRMQDLIDPLLELHALCFVFGDRAYLECVQQQSAEIPQYIHRPMPGGPNIHNLQWQDVDILDLERISVFDVDAARRAQTATAEQQDPEGAEKQSESNRPHQEEEAVGVGEVAQARLLGVLSVEARG